MVFIVHHLAGCFQLTCFMFGFSCCSKVWIRSGFLSCSMTIGADVTRIAECSPLLMAPKSSLSYRNKYRGERLTQSSSSTSGSGSTSSSSSGGGGWGGSCSNGDYWRPYSFRSMPSSHPFTFFFWWSALRASIAIFFSFVHHIVQRVLKMLCHCSADFSRCGYTRCIF